MAKIQKNVVSSLCTIASKQTAKERLQAFWNVFDKDDDVLVVINADPDALAGAMAVKRLLRYRVKNVVIAHPNEIRRLNNVAMVERLKIPIERLNNVKLNDYRKKVMVDSQPDHLPCFEKSISMLLSITIRRPANGKAFALSTSAPITVRRRQ